MLAHGAMSARVSLPRRGVPFYEATMARRTEPSLHELTVYGIGDHRERRLRIFARAEGISLDEAVLLLLRRGVRLPSHTTREVIGDALDHLAGTWTPGDLREFEAAIGLTRRLDEAFRADAQPPTRRRRR